MVRGEDGSVLWADIEEHAIPYAPKAYGLNKVFQVFGHTKLNKDYDMIQFDDFAMIDSRQCFMIDEGIEEKIISVYICGTYYLKKYGNFDFCMVVVLGGITPCINT